MITKFLTSGESSMLCCCLKSLNHQFKIHSDVPAGYFFFNVVCAVSRTDWYYYPGRRSKTWFLHEHFMLLFEILESPIQNTFRRPCRLLFFQCCVCCLSDWLILLPRKKEQDMILAWAFSLVTLRPFYPQPSISIPRRCLEPCCCCRTDQQWFFPTANSFSFSAFLSGSF